MRPSEEDEIVSFLSKPQNFSLAAVQVEIIETHCARVFLVGDDAYKIKKRVKFPFLDFTSLQSRHAACKRELELNQPYAPSLYLGLIAITRTPDGHMHLGGAGETIDWAVHMRRFDQEDLLTSVFEKGVASKLLPQKLADLVAIYHCRSPAVSLDGSERMRRVVEGIASELLALRQFVQRDVAERFRVSAQRCLSDNAHLLADRGISGAMRRCHGDLHLSNIVLIDGEPVPFDALEFSEDLATIDVLYDLAFLLMDLDNLGCRAEANAVLNSYVAAAPLGSEIEGLACLPLFLGCRAAIRGMVTFERAHQSGIANPTKSVAIGNALLSASISYLQGAAPIAIVIGGLSGSGKSTLGKTLAPILGRAPGAIHLRSDVERKRLAGVDEQWRLGPEHYTAKAAETIYAHLSRKAAAVIASGHSVVVDAVFARADERAAIEDAISHAGGTFFGLWLDAPADQLLNRVKNRRGDASDATEDVVRSQIDFDLGSITWRQIDASNVASQVAADACAVCGIAIPRCG